MITSGRRKKIMAYAAYLKLKPERIYMKINEVPQDRENYKGKSDVHKLLYVVSEEGKYTSANSEGWEVENLATRQAWEAQLEDLNETEQKVLEGTLSPIAYFMKKNLMDTTILARYVGLWQWRVKRHLKPAVFSRLKRSKIEQYARVFKITPEELANFGK